MRTAILGPTPQLVSSILCTDGGGVYRKPTGVLPDDMAEVEERTLLA